MASTDGGAAALQAAAEARRQKILARGRERLSRITVGPSSDAEGPTTAPPAAQLHQPAQEALPQTTTDHATRASTPSSTNVPAQQNPDKSVIHAIKPAPTDVTSSPMLQNEAVQPSTSALSRSRPRAGSRFAPSIEATAESEEIQRPLKPADSVFLGADLELAIRCTRFTRILAACFLAYMLVDGSLQIHQLWISPVLLLIMTQVVIILIARVLITFPRFRNKVADIYTDQAVPPRLRGFGITGLVPGLQNTLAGFSSIRELSTTVMDGAAVFLVAYISLQLSYQ